MRVITTSETVTTPLILRRARLRGCKLGDAHRRIATHDHIQAVLNLVDSQKRDECEESPTMSARGNKHGEGR